MTFVKLTFSLASVSATTPGEQAGAGGAARDRREPQAEQCSEGVGSAVAEHDPLPQVLREDGEGGTEWAGDQSPGGPAEGGRGQQGAGLPGPAGPQVEQIEQVRRPGDQPGGEDAVDEPRTPRSRRVSTAATAAAAPMPATLTAPAETRPAFSAARWPASPLSRACSGRAPARSS